MKYFVLMWAGMWRKQLRLVFTFLSIITAFVLYGSLHSITAGRDAVVGGLSPNRVRVQSLNRKDPVPLAFAEQIKRVPHIASVRTISFMKSYYQDSHNTINAAALGGDRDLHRLPEVLIPKDQSDAFAGARTGAVVGKKLADKYGWHVGDTVPLVSVQPKRDGSTSWIFQIVGIYDMPRVPDLAREFWFNIEYLEENRLIGLGTANSILLRTDDHRYNAEVASAIDALFANSSNPTYTRSDRDGQMAVLRQIMDLDVMVTAITSIAFVTLLFLTGNALMQSVKERIVELAILKAIGFPDNTILALVILEGVVIYFVASLVGFGLTKALLPIVSSVISPILNVRVVLPPYLVATGVATAIVVGAVSAAAPAIYARQMPIVRALTRR